MFGGTIGPDEQLIVAVSQSGLIAVPPGIDNVLFGGQSDAVASDTLLIAVLWGEEAAGLPTPTPEVTPTPPPECYYVIRSGDTLTRIAQRRGVSLQELLEANPQITNPQLIRAGTRLILPGCVNTENP
ncbi:MAG: LysM peptidoglycan-binding domain-containing protein [Chloroflexi bacterium]|nr:LysM peptidoglycan-binding domain-containing protein [Chloroflexota bacterium]